MDIVIYGHLTIDTIFNINNNESICNKDLGGIVNNWIHFLKINKLNYTIQIKPLYFGEAFIIIDKNKAERYSKCELNLKKYDIDFINTKWTHLMYLNYLNLEEDTIKEFQKHSKIISGDLCLNNEFNYDLIPYIDFLFISEDEYNKIDILKKPKQFFILHTPTSSKAISENITINIDEKELNENNIYKLKNVNVLGAGDFFATSFIYKLLELNLEINTDNIKKSLLFAHKSVYENLS